MIVVDMGKVAFSLQNGCWNVQLPKTLNEYITIRALGCQYMIQIGQNRFDQEVNGSVELMNKFPDPS